MLMFHVKHIRFVPISQQAMKRLKAYLDLIRLIMTALRAGISF